MGLVQKRPERHLGQDSTFSRRNEKPSGSAPTCLAKVWRKRGGLVEAEGILQAELGTPGRARSE